MKMIFNEGIQFTLDPDLIVKEYSGGGYDYLCEAAPESALTAAAWKITRFGVDTIDYAGLNFDAVATDLATVAALTYNGGVAL